MLAQLRSKKNMKFIMVGVAFAFVVGMALLGIDPGGGQSSNANAAAGSVNGRDIPYEIYNNRVTQLAELERQRFRKEELSTSDYERIGLQAWEGLVEEVLTTQEALRMGLSVTDDEIIGTLENNPPQYLQQSFLSENGQFDRAAYQRALNDPTIDWRQHEEYLRVILPSLKLRQMVYSRATVSEIDVRREFARRNQRNTVEFIGVQWRDIDLPEEPSEEDVRTHYDSNQNSYLLGASVAIEAVKIEKSANELDRHDLLSDVKSILDELESGRTKDFATLASIYTEGGGADRGGALGWVDRGLLPSEVEEIVWSLGVGKRTDAIDTELGVYAIQVDSMRTEGDASSSLYLRQIYMKHEASSETLDSLQTVASDVRVAADEDFAASAEKHGLTIETIDRVEKNGFVPGIGLSLALRDWAFKAAPGEVGGPFATDDLIFVAQLVRLSDSEPIPFADAKSRVRQDLIEKLKKGIAAGRVNKALEAMRAGSEFANAASQANLKVHTPAPFNYYESVPDVGSANAFSAVASELKLGELSGVVETLSGTYAIRLMAREPFDEDAFQGQREINYQNLLSSRGVEIYNAWLTELRDRAEIKDNRSPGV